MFRANLDMVENRLDRHTGLKGDGKTEPKNGVILRMG